MYGDYRNPLRLDNIREAWSENFVSDYAPMCLVNNCEFVETEPVSSFAAKAFAFLAATVSFDARPALLMPAVSAEFSRSIAYIKRSISTVVPTAATAANPQETALIDFVDASQRRNLSDPIGDNGDDATAYAKCAIPVIGALIEFSPGGNVRTLDTLVVGTHTYSFPCMDGGTADDVNVVATYQPFGRTGAMSWSWKFRPFNRDPTRPATVFIPFVAQVLYQDSLGTNTPSDLQLVAARWFYNPGVTGPYRRSPLNFQFSQYTSSPNPNPLTARVTLVGFGDVRVPEPTQNDPSLMCQLLNPCDVTLDCNKDPCDGPVRRPLGGVFKK